MLNSLNHQAASNSVEIGFGHPYAAYHEWGTKTMKRRGMLTADPDAREFGEGDEKAIIDLLQGWFG